MHANHLVEMLKKVDSRVWTQSILFGPPTCLWVGEDQNPQASRKISAIPIGIIPEFTQLDPNGKILALGWRRILEKCVSAGRMNRAKIEKAFGKTLDVSGPSGQCISCKKLGKDVPANGKGSQCDFHRNVLSQAYRARQQKDEELYQRRKEGVNPYNR